MIQTLARSGPVPTARIVCDGCGRGEVVVCDYDRLGRLEEWRPNKGQANRKITGQGWEAVKGRHHCPACKTKRRASPTPGEIANEEVEMTKPIAVVAALRDSLPRSAQSMLWRAETLMAPDAAFDRLLRGGIVGMPIGMGSEWMAVWRMNNIADLGRSDAPTIATPIWC